MIPGEIFPAAGDMTLNEGAEVTVLMVANTGDRPVQVGSHYHFAETNPGLSFDRDGRPRQAAGHRRGHGRPVRAGPKREVRLVPLGGGRVVYGFNSKVMGPLGMTLDARAAEQGEGDGCAGAANHKTGRLTDV